MEASNSTTTFSQEKMTKAKLSHYEKTFLCEVINHRCICGPGFDSLNLACEDPKTVFKMDAELLDRGSEFW
jgi:hypothetical protein